jgi:hypothetical protein
MKVRAEGWKRVERIWIAANRPSLQMSNNKSKCSQTIHVISL